MDGGLWSQTLSQPTSAIRSMTGYGEATSTLDGASFFVEVRSLNNRYFKATIRLPEEFQGLEAEIESQLRRRIARGSITLVATCADDTAQAAFTINHRALEQYIAQLQRTPQVASGAAKLDVGPLLSLPGVLQPPANEEARLERARRAFLPLVDRATDAMIAMRHREGQALLTDLLAQRDQIEEHLKVVRERAPRVVHDYETRLRQRIDLMLREAGVSVQPVELIREIAVYAERSDISEEITRLSEHLRQYEDLLLRSPDRPVGRTLDFLTQELLREANTMASKSSDSLISRAIVEIKGCIDRIKEQVQNIE